MEIQESEGTDRLMTACDAVLREVGGFSVGDARLAEALPLIRSMVAAIRAMDEVDVGGVEPMTVFRPLS
jgi:hypothetical protein